MTETELNVSETNAQSNDVPTEKMLPQSEVNKIVGAAKEGARRQAEQEFENRMREMEAKSAAAAEAQIAQSQENRNENVSREIDANQIYEEVQNRFNEEMRQRQIESEMKQVADSYLSKMAEGPKNYEDFSEITKDFNPVDFPELIYLVSGIDNASDVVYELAKNPSKLSSIDYLAHRSPTQAKAELQKLAKSVLDNRNAMAESQNQDVNAPLDRLSPSRVSGSNGKMSIRDLRNQPWLKG